MTVPEMRLVPNRDLSEVAARKLTERIKASLSDIMFDIAKAHIGRVWIALEYASWGEYIKGEFNYAPLSLPRDERKAVVSFLRGQGMSTRAIASATGDSHMTVNRDLRGVTNVPPGETSESTQPDESIEPLDVEVDEDALAEELIAAEPVKITGLDGRSYQSSRPQPSPVAVQPAPAQTVTCPTCHGTGKVTQ